MLTRPPHLGDDKIALPVVVERNERRVRKSFWRKLARVAGRIPFAEDAAEAYFCAVDPQTPARVKAVLLAALAYFIIPIDLIPDFILGFGFGDDASVLAAALALVAGHINDSHRRRGHEVLQNPLPPKEPE